MPPRQDLDDPSQKCIFLSADGPFDDELEETPEFPPSSAFASRDLPDGYELRLRAYRKAWLKCLERIQSIVRSLHTPIVHAVVDSVRTAHSQRHQLPGLPYLELPVVAVSASGGSNSVISDVVTLLTSSNAPRRKGKEKMAQGVEDLVPSAVSHLYPADCTNLMNAMKSLVTSFVGRGQQEESGADNAILYPEVTKRRATASLANYDLNMLKLWYNALVELNGCRPNVVIVLHNFEQFDTAVMENVLSICSQQLPDLPLIFVLAMSAPSPVSFLRNALSRRTMSRLRVHAHTAPSGRHFVETIIEKTFFDLEFEPDIMLGTGALNFISDFCTRHTSSLDALITIIQIAYLKHAEEPLSLFIHDSTLGVASPSANQKLDHPTSKAFLHSLVTRVWSDAIPDDPNSDPIPDYLQDMDWDSLSTADLLAIIDAGRDGYMWHAQQLRLGYHILCLVQGFMRGYGYKPSMSAGDGTEESTLELMHRVLQGKVSRDVQHLARMVRKLSGTQLEALLTKLYTFFYELEPSHLRQEEMENRELIIQCRNELPQEGLNSANSKTVVSEVASNVAEWLTLYLDQRLRRLDKQVLWEVWTTSPSFFPSELINPAPRASIINALLHPHTLIDTHKHLFTPSTSTQDYAEDTEPPPIWDLPDTSILFHRYMEAPKLVNVYDWFESFAGVLETQKEHHQRKKSPTKKGKGKSKAKANGAEAVEEQGEEEWQTELQARFIRALHELDYMGFVKHTGRKADHVFRTVYDVFD